jgi:putative DNA primase/helicase
MLQGLAMYREQGLTEPDAVVKATARYRDEMDSVKRFIETQAELVSDGRTGVSTVKEAYQSWSRDEGLRPLAASQFNAALEEHGCEQKKSGNHRYWSGISLIDALENDFRVGG